MAFSAKARISLIARGARFLKLTPWHYNQWKEGLQLVFRPNAIWEEIEDPDPCENFFWFGHRGGLHKTNFFFLWAMPTGKEDPDWLLRKGVSRPSVRRTSRDPPPDRQTVDFVFFFRGRMRWCGWRVFRRKGREHISAFSSSLFRTQVRTHTNFPHRRNSVFQESVFSVHLYLHRFFTESILASKRGVESRVELMIFEGVFNIPACGG